MRLKQRVACITGGNGGIWPYHCPFIRSRRGAYCHLWPQRELVQKVEKEIGETGAEAIGIVADVGVEKDVESMVAKTVARFGTIDILVNNAAAEGPTLPIHEMDGDGSACCDRYQPERSFLLHQIRPPGHDPEKVREHLEHRLHRRRVRLSSADAIQRDQMGYCGGHPVDCRGGWSS